MTQKPTNSTEYADYSYCSQGLGSKYFREGNPKELDYEPYKNGSRIMTPLNHSSEPSPRAKDPSNNEL